MPRARVSQGVNSGVRHGVLLIFHLAVAEWDTFIDNHVLTFPFRDPCSRIFYAINSRKSSWGGFFWRQGIFTPSVVNAWDRQRTRRT